MPGERMSVCRSTSPHARALFWATIYTTIGFAVLEAWFGEHPWPWVIGGVVAVLVVTGSTWLVRRRHAARVAAEPP